MTYVREAWWRIRQCGCWSYCIRECVFCIGLCTGSWHANDEKWSASYMTLHELVCIGVQPRWYAWRVYVALHSGIPALVLCIGLCGMHWMFSTCIAMCITLHNITWWAMKCIGCCYALSWWNAFHDKGYALYWMACITYNMSAFQCILNYIASLLLLWNAAINAMDSKDCIVVLKRCIGVMMPTL